MGVLIFFGKTKNSQNPASETNENKLQRAKLSTEWRLNIHQNKSHDGKNVERETRITEITSGARWR